jgi:MSHA pilin protein MshD
MLIKPRQAGLTLVELIMFMVIVGIAVASVVQVLALSARYSPDPMRSKQALAIAEGLMEEVRLARFTFCDGNDPLVDDPNTDSPARCGTPEGVGIEPGNARPFDNVNDYVVAFNQEQTYTTDAAGNPFPAGYAATVSIRPDDKFGPIGAPIAPADGTSANMNVLLITVTVRYTYDNNARSVVLDSYRTRYAPRSI